MTHTDPRIGSRVGNYLLQRRLGRGGMSTVYFARQQDTGRAAAVKILSADLPENIDADARLEQEAKAVVRIESPHVVRVNGWGRTADNLPYIVMEYLEGRPLARLMGELQPMPVVRMIDIALQILSGLSAAHALDIIHRDLKPDNVLLVREQGQDDFVKMLDFGIAKLLGTQPHSLVHTVRGVVLGTPEYLPPEIAMDLAVSPATDIYAMGVILFEALAGRLPFTGRGPGELAEQHCFNPPPRLRAFNRLVPVELEEIINRCLEKEPEARYPSALVLAEALRPFSSVSDEAGQTIVSMAIGGGATQTLPGGPANDLRDVERALREEVARRWRAELPAALQGSLDELEAIHQRAQDVGTELALVDAKLEDVPDGSDMHARLVSLVERESQLAETASGLGHRDLTLAADVLKAAGDLAKLLSELVGADPASTATLQQVLSTDYLHDIADHLKAADNATQSAKARAELSLRRAETAEARATLLEQRAELESELVRIRAEHSGRRLRLQARRSALEAERDALNTQQAQLLAQCSLDLAVAVGVR